VELLRACAPMGVCLDTCHTHVAGYDLVSAEGYEETMALVDSTVGFDAVKVWHCNDAKRRADRSSTGMSILGRGRWGLTLSGGC